MLRVEGVHCDLPSTGDTLAHAFELTPMTCPVLKSLTSTHSVLDDDDARPPAPAALLAPSASSSSSSAHRHPH